MWVCSSGSETVKSQSPDGDDGDLLADLKEEGKKVANEIMLVSCHVPLSFCVRHIGFVIRPVSGVSTGQGMGGGGVGESDLPNAAVWVGTAAQASRGT